MKIEVGEYVRIKEKGIIGKIEQIGVSLFWLEDGSAFNIKEQLYKHSKNIIDLIEVGDVIRYRINNISTTLETKGFIKGIVDISDEEQIENIKKDKNYEIKSIVTKEQMASIEYKLEEDK